MKTHGFGILLLLPLLYLTNTLAMEETEQRLLQAIKEGNVLSVRGALTFQLSERSLHTALLNAAIFGDIAIIRVILGAPVDVNCVDQNGNTPLHLAVLNENEQTSKALIDGEYEEISSVNSQGCCIAKMCNSLKRTCLPQKKNASLNILNDNGETPIHIAARIGSTIIHQFPFSALRVTKDKFGQTALHIAVKYGNAQI